MPSAVEVAAYRRAQAAVSAAARGHLASYWAGLNQTDIVLVREALEQFLPSLVGEFGDASASLAAGWFEQLTGSNAVLGSAAAEAEVNARMRWAIGAILRGDPDQALSTLDVVTDELVKQPGRDTIAESTAKAGIRFARVPTGTETCDFCLMLASRGAVYHDRESAGWSTKFHGACDCVATPIRDDSDYPAGYDPDALYASYADARAAAKSTDPRKILSEMGKRHSDAPSFEPDYVKKISGLLDEDPSKEGQLRQLLADPKTSELTKANISEALEQHEAASASSRRDFKNIKEAREWADGVWAGPEGYSEKQLEVLRDYTENGYRSMNKTLRDSKGKRTNAQIRTMDEAMDRASRVPNDITVVRNANMRQLGFDDNVRGDPTSLIGRELVDHGYLSTSVGNRGASTLANIKMKINVPKGSRGIYVSGNGGKKGPGIISSYGGGENELILDRGSKLMIKSAKRNGSKWVVEADLVQVKR